ncbi:MAG: hypothetical protein VX498_05220 [Myxococcota bacterium]|nr:hypothetical protein [Myxococcota bacterium]
MGTVGALVLTAVVLLCTIWVASLLLGADRRSPSERPVWMGPDPVILQGALAQALHGLFDQEGQGQPLTDPATQELAAHHAHDMAWRGFFSDRDPEGADHELRRLRLHPRFVGTSTQWVTAFTPDPGQSATSFAQAVITAHRVELDELLAGSRWNRLAAGVAIERGRGAICVVVAAHWATLSHEPAWSPGGEWSTMANCAEGTRREQISVRSGHGETVTSTRPCEIEIGSDEENFSLQVSLPDPNHQSWVEILRDGEPGLRRPLQ